MGIKIYVEDMVDMVSTQDERFLVKVSAKFSFDSINFQGVGTFLVVVLNNFRDFLDFLMLFFKLLKALRYLVIKILKVCMHVNAIM